MAHAALPRDTPSINSDASAASSRDRIGRLAVIDLGGGSLECVVGTDVPKRAHGLPLGVFRLCELAPEAVRQAVTRSALREGVLIDLARDDVSA